MLNEFLSNEKLLELKIALPLTLKSCAKPTSICYLRFTTYGKIDFLSKIWHQEDFFPSNLKICDAMPVFTKKVDLTIHWLYVYKLSLK